MNLHLTTDHDNAVKWFSRIDFKRNTHANGLYLIETHKNAIVYDKPVYVGCAVLDLSKLHMMDFHYNIVQKQHGNNAELIHSDTDGFVYEIEHEDIYEWMQQNIKHFDTSDSKPEWLRNDENTKKLDKVKDELNSQIITEWVSLDPKTYDYRYKQIDRNSKRLRKQRESPIQLVRQRYHSRFRKIH
jgi:diphthamide synthase subunit DPH2